MRATSVSAPLSRRTVMAGAAALGLAGCGTRTPQAATPPPGQFVPLKEASPFPVGAAMWAEHVREPLFADRFAENFDQLTADWEMKMERVLRDDGSFDFAPADAIADYARDRGLKLHGHTLVWYTFRPKPFELLASNKGAFDRFLTGYIDAVVGRYKGLARSWDVVNEPVNEDGEGYRDCLWREVYGMDYVARSFQMAKAADPDAILFLNEYHLETKPKKRATFLRLAEQLLKEGVPLEGLGTQTHLDYQVEPGAITAAVRDLASLGLPIHISEFDVSMQVEPASSDSTAVRLDKQARLAAEAAEALMALPEKQRYGFTTWGTRDKDSWLRREPNAGDGTDKPLFFDDNFEPKPSAFAFEKAAGA